MNKDDFLQTTIYKLFPDNDVALLCFCDAVIKIKCIKIGAAWQAITGIGDLAAPACADQNGPGIHHALGVVIGGARINARRWSQFRRC